MIITTPVTTFQDEYNEVSHRTYGFNKIGASPGLIDNTLDILSLGEIYAGGKLLYMGLSTVSKASLGLKVGLGGSKNTLKSSVYFERTLGITTKIPRIPTIVGKPTSNLGIFLGRNSSVIGGSIMLQGVSNIQKNYNR